MKAPNKLTVVFTPYFDTNQMRDMQVIHGVIDGIREAHRVACEAHAGEDIKNIRFDYLNIPHSERNPLMTLGRFRVVIGCPEGEDTQVALGLEV